MISLEQVKLLESKVSRMIEYVRKVAEENAKLKEKLGSYEKRTGELEILFQRFKEDQGRIEDGILSALDLLNQFEDAVGDKISETKASLKKKGEPPVPSAEEEVAVLPAEVPVEVPDADSGKTSGEKDDSDPALSGAELDIF